MPLSAGQPEDEGGGLIVIEEIRKRLDDAIVIVMTVHGSIQNAGRAVRSGAFDYLEKPFETEELQLRVDKTLRHKILQNENQSLKQENQSLFERMAAPYQSSGIIGESQLIQDLLYQI